MTDHKLTNPSRISSRTSMLLAAAVLAAASATLPAATQAPDPQVRTRIDAFTQALSSGSAERYEAMAREHFTPGLLASRTPADRRAMVERIHADFGALTVRGVDTEDGETFTLAIRGSNGTEGRVELTLESTTPRRIARVGIEVGGTGEEGPDSLRPPVNGKMTPEQISTSLDGYLAPLASAGTLSGVVLVAKGGTPIYRKAFGLADREKQVPNTVDTRFNLGSINKIFTRTAIAQLLAARKLSLSDTVGRLLPDYPNRQALPATVEQLLEHRAGVADFFGPSFAKAPKQGFRSNADYYRFVAPQPLLFEPGARRQYCNGCYIVLGAIVERLSGIPYEKYIVEHVFEPARMATAGFFQSDRLPPDTARGYTRRSPEAAGELRDNVQMHGAAGSAAGGAYAAAADLLAFDQALRGGRLLDRDMTAWVLGGPAPAPAAGGAPGGPGPGRAAGSLGIAGGAPGVSAVLESDGDWTVVVLGNLDPPTAEQLGAALHRQLTR